MRKEVVSTLALALLLLSVAYSQLPTPPPCAAGEPRCYSNVVPYAGHGPASGLPQSLCSSCTGDNRRVIVIRIDATWGSPTNSVLERSAVCC